MTANRLHHLFHPERVAVIGASERLGSVGDMVLRNLLESDYDGDVFPVNPKHDRIRGVAAHASITETPETAELAVVCTPAKTVPKIVEQCGEAGVRAVVVISAGFGENGEEGEVLKKQIRQSARAYPDLRIVGPNCLGVMAPGVGLNASFAANIPLAGRVAFVSQSGALCTSVLDWALQEGIGFSYFVSIGNMLDVDFADLIEYFATDSETDSLVLYVESIRDAQKFLTAAERFTADKPLVAYKAGRFPVSAEAAESHTGAMAGSDAVFDAAFRRCGIERATEIGEIFECAELLARGKMPSGPHLAIVTNAGGAGVVAADALVARNGTLASLSQSTFEALDHVLPDFWSRGNPIDVLGDARADRYREATRIVLADEQVDATLVILTPQAMTEPTASAHALGKLAREFQKPVLAVWMGGRSVQEGIECLSKAGVPTYDMPEQAIQAYMHLVSYSMRHSRNDTMSPSPIKLDLDRERIAAISKDVLEDSEGNTLLEHDAKRLLAAYDIAVTETTIARSEEEAVEAAEGLGYPVVLKVVSPDIAHKAEVGGVALNVQRAADVRSDYRKIRERIEARAPDAAIAGVTVQPMVTMDEGVELILGSKQDPTFGPVVMIGAGGTAAEVFDDHVLELAPLSREDGRRMLESLRSWPLLHGYRGRRSCDVDALVEVLLRFSRFVVEQQKIVEFDINPLLASPEGVVALDARAEIDRDHD